MDDGEKQKSHFLNSLRVLEVDECCQLVCLSEEKEEETRGKQQCLGLPCGLETLRLYKCDKLEKLPSDLASLRTLQIQDCRRLSCLPEMGFPSTLETLRISGCELLTCLSPSSSSSMAMAIGANGNGMPLPHSLKDLLIDGCKNLESLVVGSNPQGFTSPGSSPSLESVGIWDCPKLKSLPEGLIHRRLKALSIEDCQNLSISSVLHHLTALVYLNIWGWPAGLLSIQQGQGGPNPNSLPPNLRNLTIHGPSVTPNDEQLFSVPLPPSLTTLEIYNFKRLSLEVFQNATSLEELTISDCPGLTSIPDQLLLPSLRSLLIINCPGLTSVPDQLLPPSLGSLEIDGCPLLAHEIAKGEGRYWPKVKFIPEVEIDRHSIFD